MRHLGSIRKLLQGGVYFFCRFVLFVLYKSIWRLEIRGRHHIPREGAVIVAANHSSYVDPPLIGVAFPRALHYLAKISLFKFPPAGWILKIWNAHPTSRAGGAEGIKEALRLLKEGDAFLLFPEGRRIRTGHFGPPKAGVGLLAHSSGVPVIPAYVHNGDKFFRFKKLAVVFGAPLRHLPHHSYQKFAEEVMAAIQHLKDLYLSKSP